MNKEYYIHLNGIIRQSDKVIQNYYKTLPTDYNSFLNTCESKQNAVRALYNAGYIDEENMRRYWLSDSWVYTPEIKQF